MYWNGGTKMKTEDFYKEIEKIEFTEKDTKEIYKEVAGTMRRFDIPDNYIVESLKKLYESAYNEGFDCGEGPMPP